MSNILFNNDWMFSKQDVEFEDIFSPQIQWDIIDIPHDWLIYDTMNLYQNGLGLYKKTFTIGKDLADSVYRLYFEGVYMNSSVYVNQKFVGEWKYGYSSFELDITNALCIGENTILVKVVHQSPNTRWYSGAGIYRNIWLNRTGKSFIVSDGTYVHTTKQDGSWCVDIETEIVSDNKYKITHTLFDENDVEIACTDSEQMIVANPKIWDISTPNLYTLCTKLIIDNNIADSFTQKIGFRTVEIDAQKGFFINGRYQKLNGVCEHHDLGALGSAFNKEAMRRKYIELRKMGVNAIRTAHNMPAKDLMTLADEMGFLIISEAFDMWESQKTTYDYARFFLEWFEKDVASWVRRDRNHPSLLMWSIGNEIHDTHAGERGMVITKALRDAVRKHDPKKNGFTTFGSNYMQWENSQKCGDELDASGYNYGERLYDSHHTKNPNRVIYGSETASTVQSRGIYHFPLSSFIVTHKDKQCSSLGNCCTAWGAKSTHVVITNDRDASYSLGQFLWTGFDYIGEPTPYSTKNSYFGQIDTAGYWKDAAYLYQAEWTDYRISPMVHLLPYWDYNEGQLVDITAFFNAPVIELFFNNESLGKHAIDHKKDKILAGIWQLAYKKGELRAVAYDENGVIVATDIQKSFGDAKKLALSANKPVMQADGCDLIFVDISSIDENGVFVANANNRVNVEVSGAGRLVGLDNGDSTDYDQYKGTSRRLFSGRLLAIVAAKKEAGEIKINVTSKEIKSASLILSAIECNTIGTSCVQENCKSKANEEIPCRKIELVVDGCTKLDKDHKTVTVQAKLLPCNTSMTMKDLKFIAITDGDIETNIVKIEKDGGEAIITALGDGNFRLRAYVEIGGSMVLSEIAFCISGLGAVSQSPYQYVSAGLYNLSEAPMQNGKFGGVTFYSPKGAYIGFENLDFGRLGSDEITVAIMSYAECIPLEFWDGIPNEKGSELLLAVDYVAEYRWDTYIERTYKLNKKLVGNKSICISVMDDSTLDFKGFIFTKPGSAYGKWNTLDKENIYGDSYIIEENGINEIGNNVTIDFGIMDFNEGLSSIDIMGRSHTETNSIHIKFVNIDIGEEITQIVEVKGSEHSIENRYNLSNVSGKQKVNFVFMPGSKFDFVSFVFNKIN